MCNKLHEGFEFIPETDIGYKIVGRHLPTKRYDMFHPWLNDLFVFTRNKWTVWSDAFEGDGFCFFLTFEETIKCLKIAYQMDIINDTTHILNTTKIVQIKYRKGLGKFSSTEIKNSSLLFAIAKEFKIVKVFSKAKIKLAMGDT